MSKSKMAVDILMLDYKSPEVESEAVRRLLQHTDWPYTLIIEASHGEEKCMARLWNEFVKRSTREFQVVIDSDAFVTERWLQEMMAAMMRFKAGVVVPVTNKCHEHVQISGTALSLEDLRRMDLPEGKFPHDRMHEDPFVFETGLVSGFCFLIRKQALEDAGWFDEEFGFYGQDSDLFTRMALLTDRPVVVQPKAFVEHLHGHSAGNAESYDFDSDKKEALARYRKKLAMYKALAFRRKKEASRAISCQAHAQPRV